MSYSISGSFTEFLTYCCINDEISTSRQKVIKFKNLCGGKMIITEPIIKYEICKNMCLVS